MKLEEEQMKSNPRTKFTLENYLKIMFYPNGVKEFMEGVNYELELGPRQSALNKNLGIAYDFVKYGLYAGTVGIFVYEILK
jgi:hypothetical protein